MSSINDLSSKYQRVFSVVSDAYGIDPLLDTLVPLILNITVYTQHIVTQDERGAPDLISLREYGTDELWWMMLTYNGICSYTEVVEGVVLKIPDFPSLIALTTLNSIRPTEVARVITI